MNENLFLFTLLINQFQNIQHVNEQFNVKSDENLAHTIEQFICFV